MALISIIKYNTKRQMNLGFRQHKVLLLPKKMVIERDIFILGLSSAAVSHYNSEI
jgi:hypothetical protein